MLLKLKKGGGKQYIGCKPHMVITAITDWKQNIRLVETSG